MNVNKININRTEPTYYIASDIYDISAHNNGATFASLSALLSAENLSTLIPIGVRCGGMTIRFIQSSDNRYVQYRLAASTWSTDIHDWTSEDPYFVDKIMQEVNEAIDEHTPIEIHGDVTNAPDEEDLTSVNVGGTDVLKFKDKTYNPLTYSGMGRKILRKNIVDGVNILTLSMINQANTIYVIQYDFILSEDVTIPANCVLEFDGGSISGNTYTLKHQRLYIINNSGNSCFINCYPEPLIAREYFITNNEIFVDWFKSTEDTQYNNTPSFNLAFNCAWKNRDYHACVTLKFSPHPYYLTNISIEGDAAKFTPVFDFNNATIYPVGNNIDSFISIKNNGEQVTTSRNFHFSNAIFYINDANTTHRYTDFIKIGEDSVYAVDNVLIDNCTFDGIICTNAIIENFMGYGLTIRHSKLINILSPCHYGIYCHHGEIVSGKYYHTYDLNILDCDISSHLQVGVSIGSGSIGIRDSVILGNGIGIEIREQNSGNLTAVVNNVYFEQNTDCHVFIGRFLENQVDTSEKSQGLLITGCKFDTDGNSGPAIKVQPYASACVIGNMFVGAKGAIQSYVSVDDSLPTKIYTYGNKIPTIEYGNVTGFSNKQILADALFGENDLTSKDYKYIIAISTNKYYKLVMPFNNYVNIRMLLTNNTAASYTAFRCENTTTGYKVCGSITQSLPKIGDDNNIYIALAAWDRFYMDSNDSLAQFEEIDAATYNAQTLRDFSN